MFDFLKKKCPICGMKDTGKFIERNGKKFCTEGHAVEFEKNLNEKVSEVGKGSCCG